MGDFVWLDENKNGKQDKGEPGIADVVLILTDMDGNPVKDTDGNLVQPTKTDKNGYYHFDRLPAGQYQVSIDKEASKDALANLEPT
ncbi:hypothetical protein OMY_00217, partial [Enterococcus sulfureus ATCC 49903]|uniref:SdrD B-like domain-containing protein n=1 Tax=Enterococcus sulfureus TaxID=1356 RepID=UPI000338114F